MHLQLLTTITVDEPAPGLKAIFSFIVPDQRSGKVRKNICMRSLCQVYFFIHVWKIFAALMSTSLLDRHTLYTCI